MEEPGRPRQYALGLATGFYAPAGADPEHDITGWRTRLEAGEPYDSDPALRQIIDQVTRFHSAYYIDDSEEPAPLFIYNAFTDDLFPAAESLRFWRKTRAATTMADFGTPSTTSSYTLCVYDGSASVRHEGHRARGRHLRGTALLGHAAEWLPLRRPPNPDRNVEPRPPGGRRRRGPDQDGGERRPPDDVVASRAESAGHRAAPRQ